MRYFYFFFFLLLFYNGLYAQFCGRVEYTISDGMALPFEYILTDSKGFLWVGSRGQGLSRFNGKEWKKFTTDNGLGANWTRPYFEDKEGGIWFLHYYYKGVSRFIDGEFYHYPIDNGKVDSLKQGQSWYPFNHDAPYMIYEPQKQKVLACYYPYKEDSLRQYYVSEFDYETQSFKNPKALVSKPFQKKFNPLKPYYFPSPKGEFGASIRKENTTTFLFPNLNIKENIEVNYDQTEIFIKKESVVFLWGKGNNFFVKENNITKEFASPNLKRYGNSNSNIPLEFNFFRASINSNNRESIFFSIWKINDPTFEDTYLLAEHNKKTYEIEQAVLFQEAEWFKYFSKDNAGTYWYSTGNKVVRLFPNQLFISSSFQGMPAQNWGVAQDGTSKIWLSSWGNGIVTFDGFRINKPNSLIKYSHFLDGSEMDKSGNVYFPYSHTSKHGIIKIAPNGKNWRLHDKVVSFFLARNNKGELISGTKDKGLWRLQNGKEGIDNDDWIKYGTDKGLGLQNVITALQDKKGRYWMGRASQGLAIYFPKQDTIYNWLKAQKQSNYGVMSMDEDHKGNIWMGTDRGLVFFENRDSIPSNFDFETALEPVALDYTGASMITVCKIYDENTLIIGNEKGYFLIDLVSWYSNPQQLYITPISANMGHQGGTPNQNGIWIDNNKDVWLACNKGAVRYTPNLLARDTLIPSIQIDSMVVDETIYSSFDATIRLSSVDRTLSFHFSSDTLNPYLYDNISYRYRITGDTAWSALTKEEFKGYLNLSSGNYTFEVLAEKNGLRSKPVQVQFRIAPVWWQNPVFWLTVLGIGLGVALYLRKKQQAIYEQNLQLEKNKVQMAVMAKEKDKLQVQAIVNQLNPHFINNALQWLQVRLDNNDDDEGVSVVGKLSQNISTVFKNSRNKQSYHSLPSEMKLAENYLYIQKMRFREKLNYQLPSKEELSKYEEVNIPLLNIQIHVENAVEHGIRNKKHGSGNVQVSLEDKGDFVKLIIEDDGVGRAAAKVIGSKGTQNGTKMLKELESIFNKQNDYKLRQYFEDDIFTDTEGKTYGTRSIIEIPKQFNYEI